MTTQTTNQIILGQRATGVHAALATEEGRISTKSAWTDETWYLDPPDARLRASDCTLFWKDLPESLETTMKALAWSLFVQRPKDKPLALSAAAGLGHRLRYLADWMIRRGHRTFSTITRAAVGVYRQDLVAHLKERGRKRNADYDTQTVASYLVLLTYGHEQARHLAAVDVPHIAEDPFPGSSAWTVAEGVIPVVDGFVPPLPDEVAIRVVQAAYRFIQEPADDILKLASMCLKERRRAERPGRGSSHIAINRRMRRKVAGFRFSTCEGEEQPWHPPLDEYLAEAKALGSANDRIRRLMANLTAAAAIVVRFQSGVRHGELFAFKPGFRRGGLPACVEMEQSLSGAYDLFFVKGVVAKGWDHPSDTRWLIGGRLAGSEHVPPAVRALQVLCRLGAPWRLWSTVPEAKDALLLQFSTKGIPTSPDLIVPLGSEKLALHMKDFISEWAGLEKLDASDERLTDYVQSKGRNIQSRQWRKTWANFVIRTDPRLLPAISQQFQHISTALTEEAYIGKDAMQLGIVESAAMENAVRYMRRALDGEPGVGGSMRKVVQDGLDDLRINMRGLGVEEKDVKVRTWLIDRDVRMWPSPHGKCFIGLLPGESRCHERAGSTDWSNQTPNFGARNPRLCSGCPCFGVDEDDLPFWTRRYLENRAIWEDAVRRRMEVGYTVARERWTQSENVLRSLGIDPSQLGKGNGDAAQAQA